MGWISALGIPNHMKLLRILANRTGHTGGSLLFGFILARMSHVRFLSTVCVLVDNRDLTNLDKLTNFGVFLMAMTHIGSPFRPDGPEPPLRFRRFAYGYALDGSEYPSFKGMVNPVLFWIPPQLTRFLLTPSIGLQWQPGGPAVLACRALLESSVTWFSCLSAKLVVFTWSTTWVGTFVLASFLVSTLCSFIATVYLSHCLKLKICGKKHSVCSIVSSQVQFQPAVELGA